ncbi:uncharacterized protein K452DRAFT_257269 [Aplosporella prunicola CBS 121167]|uniref:MYND-type domain-containing protein n=1 Tax=Aplosporella prunicola CBS 121167 TaxID=1176127 RepID=A0A6A6B3F9_9PEZI|nr:uncharacterized protein K452DRAFT_257269 [Aplosporella prunicola CBS 121167]KAF2137795.1 hypothetical protein K452DRAFT_257269 [Aplosporella prunicola CBS 121167]
MPDQASIRALNLCPCANTGTGGAHACIKPGANACSRCYLVRYCSSQCQKAHWKQHKTDCNSKLGKQTWRPSWDLEGRRPAFVTPENDDGLKFDLSAPAISMVTHGTKKFLWGNVPAFDLLNLKHNEGTEYNQHIRILFAASGDLRNVVRTIAGIPKGSTQSIDVVINDYDFDIVARNAILILIAMHLEPEPAADAMIHTWYSAFLSAEIASCLNDTVLPSIRTVCEKIQAKPDDQLLSKKWTTESCTFRLVLTKACWDHCLRIFETPATLTTAAAHEMRLSTVLAESRKDYVERALYFQPRGWRMATIGFRKDGILLPFGASRHGFDTPNPTFYYNDQWPMMDSADPLAGWPMEEILQAASPAKNDLYGGLFLYLRPLLVKFCKKIRKHAINFELLHTNATELPGYWGENQDEGQRFDRIEVSNIADGGYLGIRKCLKTFAPLLKPVTENPHATLVTLFLNAINEVESSEDRIQTLMLERARLMAYVPVNLSNKNKLGADKVKITTAPDLLRDFDGLFARYAYWCDLNSASEDAGMRIKTMHTLIEPWPMRLKDGATKEEFERLFGSHHCGSERYVEWQRVRG